MATSGVFILVEIPVDNSTIKAVHQYSKTSKSKRKKTPSIPHGSSCKCVDDENLILKINHNPDGRNDGSFFVKRSNQ